MYKFSKSKKRWFASLIFPKIESSTKKNLQFNDRDSTITTMYFIRQQVLLSQA